MSVGGTVGEQVDLSKWAKSGCGTGPDHYAEIRGIVFEYQGKQIAIDLAAGVWVRGSEAHDWRCFAAPCTVSGAIQAVEFLAQE